MNCDFRILVLPITPNSCQPDRSDPSQRTITFGTDTAACKTVVFTNHPAARGYLIHKVSLLRCAHSTAGRDKVYGQRKENAVYLGWIGKADGH